MPSSSSSEEDLSKFQEAADTTLYNDSLFKGEQASKGDKLKAVPPSQRIIEEEDESFRKELHVTPEFQSHVAKHLTKLLDSQLDINDFGVSNDQKSKETSKNSEGKDQSRHILKPKRHNAAGNLKEVDGQSNSGGVRLFGASAVFLSNMNITPQSNRRRKRGRKFASFSSGSESSSEDSDSDDMQKLSAAAVSSDWVLSGAATKGWANKEGKIERCVMNKAGILVPVKDDLSRGYESLNEIGSSNNNSKEVVNSRSKDDMACLKLSRRKPSHLETELAASFSSVVSIGSDSQADTSSLSHKCKRKKLKKKKRRKEQHSEDATTETTEVEDVIEERKKAKKERRKKPKRLRVEEKKAEESDLKKDCVPGLIEEDDGIITEKWKRREKRIKRKAKKREARLKDFKQPAEGFLKKKRSKSSRISKRDSKKKITKKVLRLSEDLAKLMMTPTEAS
ncbi:Protein CUSTOS [Frankliniella fusca]|uniref:Protein CUSTOS n=1 Tax=Frankliniella fusca TaxID=407009 RepID=A0AAE1LR85_9NEOP|nr:Protein CUSTOS [Frankliniella fusca]